MAKRTMIPPRIVNAVASLDFKNRFEGAWSRFPNSDAEMQPEASFSVPLMERQACLHCGHLHRKVLVFPTKKCKCCQADIAPRAMTEVYA